MNEFDLDNVLERARTLDDEAMTELYQFYYPKIVKFIYYRARPNDAEDLAGEVFLKVIRSIKNQRGNFEAWLYRIARNVIIDKGRYMNSRPETELNGEFAEQIEDTTRVHASIDAKLDIHHALSQVNDEQREFLIFKFIQGLNNKEIAMITDKSIGALRAIQFRALKALNGALS
ncbi:MAG: RNA polymerase sigma factor [Victivallaceae bacterium]|nr:RNA polymerase sigma factor [Victivallaceae bacterium]